MTARVVVSGRVTPAGQVAVPAVSSTVKSSTVNPPGTAGVTGHGFTSGRCPA